MARKRRYGSALGEEGGDFASPYLEAINLPDENYYRNMTESPMELDQPHVSTNPIKHGLNRTNMNNTLAMQDRQQQLRSMEGRMAPKARRKRTLIGEEVREKRRVNTNEFLQDENVDIFQDELSLRSHRTGSHANAGTKNTFSYNTRSNAIPARQKGTTGNDFLDTGRKRVERGSSNLPPLPRTEDYWPKINKDSTQEHEIYLNTIRDQHFNRQKSYNTKRNEIIAGEKGDFHEDSEIVHDHRNNAYNVTEGIHSVETPLKSFRSEMKRPTNNRHYNQFIKEPDNSRVPYSRRELADSSRVSTITGVNNEAPSFHGGVESQPESFPLVSSQRKIKIHCDAMVGGDTPLKDLGFFRELETLRDDTPNPKTSEVGVGPSPKVDANSHDGVRSIPSKEAEENKKDIKQRSSMNGSILRKSIDNSYETSKQVRFSTEKASIKHKEVVIPEVQDLKFDPAEVPLIDFQDHSDRFGTVDFDETIVSNSSIRVDEDKILDAMTVDNNICLRLVQLSKEEVRLFEEAVGSKAGKETQPEDSSLFSVENELVIKAITGIHRYFLNKAFEYESSRGPELRNLATWIPEVRHSEKKSQMVSSEREELIAKIGMLNMNISKLTSALEDADQLRSKLSPGNGNSDMEARVSTEEGNTILDEELEYIFKSTSKILKCLEASDNSPVDPEGGEFSRDIGEVENPSVGQEDIQSTEKGDINNACPPTPVISSEDSVEVSPPKNKEDSSIDIERLLTECHQSQFLQMESLAVLNDFMSLLDDAEVGMQNFQRLLAKKAFDTQDSENQQIGYVSGGSMDDGVEDTLLKLQRGVSITPRFSLEESLNYRRNSTTSRRSLG
ncbi:hypothetical protein HWI79_584 [Cryptosporidium felis]|nr:hypothetical protein HWI79_584 [Cryptosporidium felis]